MFQKVLEYAGEYRKITYLSMVVMLIGIVMNVLPFLFIYQLIRPLLLGESLELGYAAWRVAAIAVCGILYAVLYVKGLSLSHRATYNTLKNLRLSLQGKLEQQPLGVIQEKGVGALKKMFIDDIDSIVNADQICVLEQGTVADVGTHEELLDRCPEYRKLWQAAEDSAQWGVNQRGGAAQ